MVDYAKKPWWWQPLSTRNLKLQIVVGVCLILSGGGQALLRDSKQGWSFWFLLAIALVGAILTGLHVRTLVSVRRGDTVPRDNH